MPKSHVVNLTIINGTHFNFESPSVVLKSGRLNQSEPIKNITVRKSAKIEFCESDYSIMTGCSGYIEYIVGGESIVIAFSNPYSGTNKIGFGIDGEEESAENILDNMGSNDYQEFEKEVILNGKSCTARMSCTGGDVNKANIEIVMK